VIINYASGFKGPGSSDKVEIHIPASDPNRFVTDIRLGSSVDTGVRLGSNQAVIELWRKISNDVNHMSRFDFRESVLLTAKRAFNVDYTETPNDFANWCTKQNQGLYLSSMHKKFVTDTISYIITGKRSLEPTVWYQILGANPTNNKDKEYKIDLSGLVDIPATMSQTLVQWVSHHNGFADLIATLNVLFGERS
jgi:hypothetical protein